MLAEKEHKTKQFNGNTIPLFNSEHQNITDNNMNLEKIYPGIYWTSVKGLCSAESLKIFGFTHIIYIDKHIIEDTASTEIQQSTKNGITSIKASILISPVSDISTSISSIDRTTVSETGLLRSTQPQKIHNAVDGTLNKKSTASAPTTATTITNENIFGHSDFETLDLNFGESSYLTTVLPSCYKAVKFIENALKNNGAVLVIDCFGEHQKCITIVVGFLMYKYNKNFLNAYQLIKRFHPNIELDRFFITQLYEYEPILQVQRTQSGGNSCSRELRSALLKRKKTYEDYCYHPDVLMPTLLPSTIICTADNFINNIEQTDILME